MEVYADVLKDLLWVLVFAVALLLECCTVQLVSIWFCVGAVAAEILELFHCPVWIQVAAFAAISALCLLLVYPLLSKNLKSKKQDFNANKILGQIGLVVQQIDNIQASGLIKINGTTWTARSVNDEIIEKDKLVKIIKIDGVKAIVKEVKN